MIEPIRIGKPLWFPNIVTYYGRLNGRRQMPCVWERGRQGRKEPDLIEMPSEKRGSQAVDWLR